MFRIDVSVLPDVAADFLRAAVCAELRLAREIPGAGSVAKKEAKKAGTSYP